FDTETHRSIHGYVRNNAQPSDHRNAITRRRLSSKPPIRPASPTPAYDARRVRYRPKRRLTRPKKNAATAPARIQRATATPAASFARENFVTSRSGPK